ncbi:MAG: hypothetical protein HYR84_10175 [Planctomycetes bacterium]|nr:hypothetical protein [Planctomycetota bacterium]
MRYWMLLLAAVGMLGSAVGCQCTGSRCGGGWTPGGRAINDHGICDCEDDNYCQSRAPWLRMAPPAAESVPAAPKQLPDGKKNPCSPFSSARAPL